MVLYTRSMHWGTRMALHSVLSADPASCYHSQEYKARVISALIIYAHAHILYVYQCTCML